MASPCITGNPTIGCSTASYAGRLEYGPLWPKPLIDTSAHRGAGWVSAELGWATLRAAAHRLGWG